MKENRFESQTKTQLARRFKVSTPTLNKWLALIPNLNLAAKQRIFTPKQVQIITEHLGEPPD